MNDNKWSNEEQIFTKQLKEIYNEDNVEIPRLDMSFLDRTYDDSKVKVRTPRILKVAAVIMLMIISSLATALLITEGYVEAFKDDITKKIFTWKSGITVTNDTTFVDEHSETWQFSDPALIPDLIDIFPEMKIPRYITSEYELETAMVEHTTGNDYIATFQYSNDMNSLRIMQMPILEDTSVNASSDGNVIKLDDRIITFWDDFGSDVHGCTITFDDASVQISTSALSNEELLKIAMRIE